MSNSDFSTSAPCLIVLGMHRSGTSLVAGCFEAAGLNLGVVNNHAPYNKKGNKENVQIRDLNDALLRRSGTNWKQPPPAQITWRRSDTKRAQSLIEPYLAERRPWGFKDPRTIWTVDGWLRLLPNAHLVGVFRHPSLVAQSLVARSGELSVNQHEAFAIWCSYNTELLRLKRKYQFPLFHLGAPNMLPDEFFAPLNDVAKQIGLLNPVHMFYDDSLLHQNKIELNASSRATEIYNLLIDSSARSDSSFQGIQ